MKKMISFLLSLVLVLTMTSAPAWAKSAKAAPFKDISGNFGYQSILKMQEMGILAGYPDGTFRPNQPLQGSELELIIDRLLAKKGITVSASDKSGQKSWKRFHSDVQVNRLEAAVALAKALGLQPVTNDQTNPFKDSKLISAEDYKYLLALYQAGYINGFPDGNFNPNALLRRAEISKIIDNISGDTADKIAPLWPTGSTMTASSIQSDSVKLVWTEASDNDKIIGYKVLYDLANVTTDSALVQTVFYKNTMSISNLKPSTVYHFQALARDAAGNWSVTGPSVLATTAAVTDTMAPVWPSGATLAASASSTNGSVTLTWPDATDNVGVTNYLVYQGNSSLHQAMGPDANSVTLSGLTDGATYRFLVIARDAAGYSSLELAVNYTEPL